MNQSIKQHIDSLSDKQILNMLSNAKEEKKFREEHYPELVQPIEEEVQYLEACLYNGKTIEEIRENMPDWFPKVHQYLYIKNCERVIECQKSGYNLNEIEPLKNFNHELFKSYIPERLK